MQIGEIENLMRFYIFTSKCEHVNLYLNIDVYIFILHNKKPRALNVKFYAYIFHFITVIYIKQIVKTTCIHK